MLHKVLFFCVFGMCSSFKLKCPDHSQWSLRARALCPSDPSKYSCIQNEHIKGYTEDCSVAEFERGGMKIILRGNLDAGPCSEERYQPGQMKYLTNISSECIFSKSQCYEEGQILYDQGSPTQDVKCRCDFTQNYDFICRTNASRYCKPSEEDCSCFKKQCPTYNELSTDYSCILTPTVAKDTLTKTLRNESVQPFIVQRNITQREKLNLSPCTAILIILTILAFPLSLLLCYDQRIDKLIDHVDRQVRKGQNNAGSRRQTSETLQQRPNSVSMTESDFSKEPNPNKQDSTTPANSIVPQDGGTSKAPNTFISHGGIQTIMSKSVATSNDYYDLKPDYGLADNESDKYFIKVPLWIKSSKIKYFSSAGKPVIGEDIHREWKRLEKDTKCRIMVEPYHKSVFKEGWIAKTNKQLMNILLMSGTLNSIEGDIILCPVNKELEAMGFDSEVLMGGLNKEKLDRLLPKTSERKLEIGDVVRIYDPENLNCHCLLLTVLEDLNIKSHSDSLEQKVAAEVINTLVTNGFRSLGISLNYNKSPEWKMFSFTLLSCLWSPKSKLKSPVVVYCFGAVDEFDSLDDYIREKLKIDNCLVPIKTEPLEYQDEENSIKVSVEHGSILDYDTKVDVLINSVGASLDLSNGIVSAKLVKMAGKSVQDECNKEYKNGIKIGDIAITSTGHMICKKIFHVALYTNWVCDGNISTEILKNIVIKCLIEAEKREMTSIAFPALGTGTLGYPPCVVAKTMFAAVDEYGRTNPKYLQQVVFVLFEDTVVFKNFENIGKWKKNKVKNSKEYVIPPKQLLFIHKDLETRVNVTDKEYVTSLKYKDLKAVVTESGSLDMKMDWNDQDGCFVTKIKTGRTEEEVKAYFALLIEHMHENKFQTVDLFFQNISSEVTVNKQLRILMREIQHHGDRINKNNSTKTGLPAINYVKLVRVFLKSEDYAEIETEYMQSNDKQEENKHGKWKWHVSDQSSFPFIVEVVGPRSTAEDVYNKVVQDISSI